MLRLFTALVGPVFAKEMMEMARRKRYYFNRVLYGLVLLLSLLMVWDSFQWRYGSSGTLSIKDMAAMARRQFDTISIVQFAAVFLLVPLFLGGVIAGEREERTLELLFTTQLADREIVLGKLFSRIVVLVLLILTALPILGLILFSGGVDPDSLWRVIGATLLATLYAGAHAIYFSTITKSPIGALVRTYWRMAIWLIGIPFALLFTAEAIARAVNSPRILDYLLVGVASVNPIGPFVLALDGDNYARLASRLEWFFPLLFVLPGAWSIFLIWRAIRRLRLEPTPFFARLRDRVVRLLGIRRSSQQWAERRAKRRSRRALRFAFGQIEVRNPLWLRARRARVYDREGYIGRIQWAGWAVAFLFVMLFATLEPRSFSDRDFPLGILGPTWIGIAALAAIFSATCLVADRRRGFFDLVLMTPLQPREVIDGTLLALWQHLRRAYWLPWVLGLLFCLTRSCIPVGVLASLVTATLFCTLVLLHGVVCSLTARTMPGALVATFLFPVLMNVGLLFFIGLFRQSSGPILWVLIVLALPVMSYWVRRRATPASVGWYFLAVHLALVGLANCWTWKGWDARSWEFPIAAMHPGFLSLVTLQREPYHWFHGEVNGSLLMLCYWIALSVNLLWARWWAIRNFDRLVGRTRPTEARPANPAVNSRLSTPFQQTAKVVTFRVR
jgi:ABC-type transport system involved in multi-copper enzyme maturation permease subunit